MTSKNDDQIITVENVSKIYFLRTRARLLQSVKILLGNDRKTDRRRKFYALHDISFKVNRGESLAVFGHNGSGKTTLLQLLAKVMRPSSGSITVNGRFTALLGTTLGFMPTMTGIENIQLMAAMYGVRIDRESELLDEIVNFADIGEFIHTYVNTYSSGMKARVGFSVAIHILPEIVFIDEVMGVGDVHFRQKCNAKIDKMRQEGRTFVIVSQNIRNVKGVCNRAIWLHQGEIMMDGSLDETWEEYRSFRRSIQKKIWVK
jgi:ABC-type polysaccharide/polyol phosphate transport system ATPase subunit